MSEKNPVQAPANADESELSESSLENVAGGLGSLRTGCFCEGDCSCGPSCTEPTF